MTPRRKNRCRNFTGIQNKKCKQGIAYETVRDESTSPYGFPCTLSGGTCESLSPYTAEELEAQDREISERIGAIGKARAAIVAHGDFNGQLPCPVCGSGSLRYSKARSNGHIHASCSTEGCVRWME